MSGQRSIQPGSGGIVPRSSEIADLRMAHQQTYINDEMQPADPYRQNFQVPTPWLGPFEVTFDPSGDGLLDLIVGPYRNYSSIYTNSPIRDAILIHGTSARDDYFEMTSSETIRVTGSCYIYYKIDLRNFGTLSSSDVTLTSGGTLTAVETDGFRVTIPLAFVLVSMSAPTRVTAIQQMQYGPIHVWKVIAPMLDDYNSGNFQVIRHYGTSNNQELAWEDVEDWTAGTVLPNTETSKRPTAQ